MNKKNKMFKLECTYNIEHGRKQGGFLPDFTCALLPEQKLDWYSSENNGVRKTRYMKRNKTKIRMTA